jgi:hypothetical protein
MAFPITINMSAWYAGTGLVGALLIAAMALTGGWLSTAPARAAKRA